MPEDNHSTIFANGEAYERFMGQWSRVSGRDFVGWLALPDGLCWLDVGCGTGAFSQVILDLCAPSEVVGIDTAGAQLAFAMARISDSRIKFQAGDALDLPFDDNAFDVAASALVLNFVADQKRMVVPRSRVLLDTRLIHDSWRKGCRDERTKARGGFGGGRP